MIIGKQDQSLAAAQKASVALASIQNLAAQQQAAQQQLAANAQSKITAIKSAANSNLISLADVSPLAAARSHTFTHTAELSFSRPRLHTLNPTFLALFLSSFQALALYKKTRRDIAAAAKQAKLATQTCTSAPVISNNFTLDNGYAEMTKTPRERNVG